MSNDQSNKSTGEKIQDAVDKERRRIMDSRVEVKAETGFGQTPALAIPTFTLTIRGGDPDRLQDFGLALLRQAIDAAPGLRGEAR